MCKFIGYYLSTGLLNLNVLQIVEGQQKCLLPLLDCLRLDKIIYLFLNTNKGKFFSLSIVSINNQQSIMSIESSKPLNIF